MKIIAIIRDAEEIQKLTTHLGIPQYIAPSPLKTPSRERYVIPDGEQLEFMDYKKQLLKAATTGDLRIPLR